ncbi:hypothetical protein [Mucilaginibacter sp. NFR10]|uniref:hypothetical protein n=1 Tax=Mucilaginibacter sp. NFR10 TaxID=1566292 RepID=UPI001113E57D|nr:hypothetical protein [Mucilaginibacter sp. NFR10]
MNRSFNLLFYVKRSKANAEGLATFTCVLLPLGTLDWRRGAISLVYPNYRLKPSFFRAQKGAGKNLITVYLSPFNYLF